MDVVHLRPISSFKGQPPHSDTLFGALCWAVRILYDEKKLLDLLEAYEKGQPPLLISSTFPFTEINGNRSYFFPKPILPVSEEKPENLQDIQRFKKFKKIRYITGSIFDQIIQGKLTEDMLFSVSEPVEVLENDTDSDKIRFVQTGNLLIEYSLVQKQYGSFLRITHTQDVPHSAINRLSGSVEEGKFFFTSEIFFKYRSGIYCLVKFIDDSWRKNILAGFRFLGDRGVGGDVSIGKGQFTVDIQEKELYSEPDCASRFTTLSLFFSEGNWTGNEAFYTLVKRKGKIESAYFPTNDIWKNTVLMYGEGSVFPYEEKKHFGSNPVVKQMGEKFKIRQYGYAFPVRMV